MDLDIQLPYLKRDDLYRHQKPYTTDFAIDHIPDSVASNHRFDYQNVHVVDAQDSLEKFDLERNGFCFIKAKTSITLESANDTEYVRDVYFPEVEKALHMALPGYERIDYLDHLVRIRDEAFPDKVGEPTTYAQPACLPHSDFSKHGGFLAMKEFFPGQEPFFENRDFDLINSQGVDDVIVFRNTSSKEQRPVSFHAAFDTGLEATDPRHSIELRVVAFRPGGEPYEQK
ncbi:hypothetical protein H9Q72_002657 [Fusarium xylarioides]|uniref:Uncharacterized protein n=1 Tax=Fusarium xylarioides TaxID=221167 RepID=A0A9P7I5T9_9HYPO|nr:hypothetical protein H9Q72_002657 [Fusarium xylarioides]